MVNNILLARNFNRERERGIPCSEVSVGAWEFVQNKINNFNAQITRFII